MILCREKSTAKLYAIKILKKKIIIQKSEVEHTMAENRVLRKTNHPFLIVSKNCEIRAETRSSRVFPSFFLCSVFCV